MFEMLREGLNHHDRIPADGKGFPILGWVKHIIAHYKKLPPVVFFTRESVPKESRAFSKDGMGSIQAAQRELPDFAMWGSYVVEMPSSLHDAFCAKIWPLAQTISKKLSRKGCPERVVSMANSMMMVSKERLTATPLATWKAVAALLDDVQSDAGNDQLLDFGWHVLFGQNPLLQPRFMQRHWRRAAADRGRRRAMGPSASSLPRSFDV